jgi:hypothetical protein
VQAAPAAPLLVRPYTAAALGYRADGSHPADQAEAIR